MQRTALYNSRKTEAQLKSANYFTVEVEILKKYCPKMFARFKKKLSLLTKVKGKF